MAHGSRTLGYKLRQEINPEIQNQTMQISKQRLSTWLPKLRLTLLVTSLKPTKYLPMPECVWHRLQKEIMGDSQIHDAMWQ